MPKNRKKPNLGQQPKAKAPPKVPPSGISTSEENGLIFPVGKVVGFHGLKGYMKLKPSSNNAALLLDVKNVQVNAPGGKIEDYVVEDIYLDRRMLFLKLQELSDRTTVERFMDCDISTTREQLRELEENEWWVDDLVGLEAYTTDGVLIGTVTDIIGSNADLLEITRADKAGTEPVLVPFVSALVPHVDIENRRIEIVDLPGLLE